MSESTYFLHFVVFFALIVSSTGWHIMIKGKGIPQNLWMFFIMMSDVFVFSSVVAVYFPFSKIYFFVAVLLFAIFSTLYIYSSPHGVLPNIIWLLSIASSALFLTLLFIYMKTALYLVYFTVPLFSIALDIPIILRKIKYLNNNIKKFTLFNISAIAFISLIVPAASAFAVMFYNAIYFNIAIFVFTTALLASLGVFVYTNRSASIGLSRITFWLVILLAFPMSFLVKLLFSLRFLIARFSDSSFFSFFVLCILFMIFMVSGIAISYFSSSVESFI